MNRAVDPKGFGVRRLCGALRMRIGGPKAAQNRRTPRRWRGNEHAKRVQGPNASADADGGYP